VFRAHFLDIQTRLEHKHYTSVQAFIDDTMAIFGSVVGKGLAPAANDTEPHRDELAPLLLNPEQKEKKKLAKRIIKGLQPLFDDAMRKESDLAGRPFEREIPNLDALFDQHLRAHQASSVNSGDDVQQTIEGDTSIIDEAEQQSRGLDQNEAEPVKGSSTVQLAPTPEENFDDSRTVRDEAADEEAIAAQLGQDAMHANGKPGHDAMDIDQSRGGGHAAPPTPPGSDQDLLGPIHHGGIPWYMAEFDPEGTTVYEERWSGREVLRDMSEELSELDDDELNDLADPQAMVQLEGAGPETAAAVQKPRQKRKRTYR
jgi:NuA3 HAT complex component NTO1